MSLPKQLYAEYPGLDNWAILRAYRGSIAHGMYTPPSQPNSIDDKDVMAICVPPLEYYYGLKSYGHSGTREAKRDEWDVVIYEARKFIRLLAKGNPNVLMMLWLRSNNYMKISTAGRILLDNRQLFVGRHVYRSFIGYAHGQLHRMTHTKFHGRMGAKRKRLVEKFGYDTKNAAHLIRLLRMGAEFLKDGELYVHRHDASQLLEIKRGEWTLEQVIAESDRWFELAEQAYLQSTLPARVDQDKVNNLAVLIVQAALKEIHGV
jgi:predicted nucleotidyltransferase